MTEQYELIAKEEIPNIIFGDKEVLKSKEDRLERSHGIHMALVLGNVHHGKVRIVFETDKGKRAVETTVWAETDEHIMLKGGVSIPIKAIFKVDF